MKSGEGYGILLLASALFLAGTLWCVWYDSPDVIPPVALQVESLPVLEPRPELAGLRVHINSATAEELEQLPGIGPTRAEAIRKRILVSGPFRHPKQLLEVDGIGEKTLENIEPYLVFD